MSQMAEFSIETRQLRRVFKLDRIAQREGLGKSLIALDGIDLQVRTSELIGILGPNGAGKTTLIRILSTLLSPTSGEAFIEGIDAIRDVKKIRPLINVVSGGETCGYGIMTAKENLRLFTELYGIPWKIARPCVEKMLTIVGLDRYKGVRVNRLSTGMRQRVNFARGFITNPKVLFLDEPTVGMDVHAAMEIRDFVKNWLAEDPSRTILLTTHYMAEADDLCDRTAIIDHGKVQAIDTPTALKKMVQKETSLELTLSGLESVPDSLKFINGIVKITIDTLPSESLTRVNALLKTPDVISEVIRQITSNGRNLVELKTHSPTLEDVFLKLTGRRLTANSDADD
jgi:ABC-2 type transport system ATP-binding protein